MRMRDGSARSRTSSSRVAWSPGQAGGQASASSPRPAASRMSRTTDDVTIGAGVARGRECESLALERRARGEAGERLQRLEARAGQNRATSDRRALRRPCRRRRGRSRMPVWRDSTNPLRSTTASSTASAAAKVCGTSPAYRRAPPASRVSDCGACSASTATRSAPRGRAIAARAPPATATTTAPCTIEIDGKPDAAGVVRQALPRRSGRAGTPRTCSLAALSECHLLSYLHACVQAGVVVVAYGRRVRRHGRGRPRRRRVPRGRAAAAGDRRRCIDDGCRDRGARAGSRVVLHRELGELPRAARADDRGRRR